MRQKYCWQQPSLGYSGLIEGYLYEDRCYSSDAYLLCFNLEVLYLGIRSMMSLGRGQLDSIDVAAEKCFQQTHFTTQLHLHVELVLNVYVKWEGLALLSSSLFSPHLLMAFLQILTLSVCQLRSVRPGRSSFGTVPSAYSPWLSVLLCTKSIAVTLQPFICCSCRAGVGYLMALDTLRSSGLNQGSCGRTVMKVLLWAEGRAVDF